MDKIIKLLILAGIIYGIIWTYQNVDFDQVVNDAKQRIEQEKTVQRVTTGRERTNEDNRNATKL